GASRELNEIDSSLVKEALEYLGWHYEKQDSQEAMDFEGEEEQNTESEQAVERMEPHDNEGLDFTNIGSTGVREPETTPSSSKDHKGFLLWGRMKLRIILLILILLGGFILWLLFQKSILGISSGSTIVHNKTENRYMIYNNPLEGEKEGFQRDIKGAYSRKELKADESETGRQRDNNSFNAAALNIDSPDSPESVKISMAISHMNIALGSSEKDSDSDADFQTGNSSHAYSLILSSCRQKKSAIKALVNLRRNGFSPLFIGKLNLGERGVWWVVYMGHYKSREEARKIREELRLTDDAIIKKTPYANLIGIFSSRKEMEEMCRRLKKLGYFPYTIEMEKDMYQLLVGGHVTMKEAKAQRPGL
ncbi:SPOR domain-containing protein, partial [bacterium]|nr:SPOR domain-containing protein [bacterium]